MAEQDVVVHDEWTRTPIVDGNDLPSAQELRGRASINQDLQLTLECADRLLQLQPDGNSLADGVLAQALTTTALVAYARCFGSGLRTRLTLENLGELGLDGEVQAFHQYLIDLRNKHIAHSVNSYESFTVGIVLSANEPVEAEGAAVLTMRHIAFTPEGLQSLGTLVTALLNLNSNRCRQLQEDAIREAQQLGAEDLRARPELSLTAPGPEQAGERRP